MQFDEFDKKIKDAAEHHHPTYDEKAWEKMEMLLDEHMPVKKDDRRKFIFLLLFLFIIGSGAFLLIRYGGQSKIPGTDRKNVSLPAEQNTSAAKNATTNNIDQSADTKIAAEKTIPDEKSSEVKDKSIESSQPRDANNASTDEGQLKNGDAVIKNGLPSITPTVTTTQQRKTDIHSPRFPKKYFGVPLRKNEVDNRGSDPLPAENKQTVITTPPVNSSVSNENTESVPLTGVETRSQPDSTTAIKTELPNAKEAEKNSPMSAKKEIKKPGKQNRSPFAVSFTVGPELSVVGIKEPGKVRMKYGAGVGYTYRAFTLRSGFYVSRKIYTAGASDYHPYYARVQEIDGDCKVYEIPVTVSYSFSRASNHNWFASTGLSSYLMKRESYGYLYKDPATGNSDYYYKTWNNKNKHYFSVLNISGGYERIFSKRLSLIVEPYVQVPLSGVGNGKMKLNSAGMLFTVNVNPFTSRK